MDNPLPPDSFGSWLRFYRTRSPTEEATPLTQEGFAELLEGELGTQQSFTSATLSNWERGRTFISARERHLLLSLVKILIAQQKITLPGEADQMLTAGGYRALDPDEQRALFPQQPPPKPPTPTQAQLRFALLLGELIFQPSEEIRQLLLWGQSGGSPPNWPQLWMRLSSWPFQGWSAGKVGSSRVDLQACKLEYSIVSPK